MNSLEYHSFFADKEGQLKITRKSAKNGVVVINMQDSTTKVS